MHDPAIIGVINDLIEACRTGEHGYRIAADRLADNGLKQLFVWRAGGWRHHADELRTLLDPGDAGSAAPPFHDPVADSAAAISTSGGDGIPGLLELVRRGEESALRHYRKALEGQLPEPARMLLQRHAEIVERQHAQLLSLQQRARAPG